MRPDRVRRVAFALFLAAATLGSAAGELGTLFHTPQERERLDRLRRGEPEALKAPAPARRRSVTGIVERSDGRNTVWIDGRPFAVNGAKGAPDGEARRLRDSLRHSDTPAIEIRRTR